MTMTLAPPKTLTFTGGSGGNWNTPQTIRVKAAADNNLADETLMITHASAGDSDYNGLSDVSLTVTVDDNDTGDIIIKQSGSEITSLTIDEGAAAQHLHRRAEP